MKCAYDMCNNLGICTDDYVKVHNRYYCKSCYEEKEGKAQIREKLLSMLKTETVKNVNIVIKDLVHTRRISWKYILFALDKIESNKMKLNYARGLIYYLNNDAIRTEYEQIEINEKYKQLLTEEVNDDDFEIQIFNNGLLNTKLVTDLL